MNKTHFLIVFLLFLLPGQLFCLEPLQVSSKYNLQDANGKQEKDDYKQLREVNAFKEALRKKNDTTNTIISNFKQEKKLDIMDENITTKGKFYFQKPDKLRWEYTDPFKYLVIINKDKVMIDDKGKKSKFDMGNNQLFQQVNDLLVNLVRGNIFSSDNYRTQFFQNEATYKVELKPKGQDMKEYIREINIVFAKSNLQVEQVKMLEDEGDYTIIDFTEKRLNEEIASHLFKMK